MQFYTSKSELKRRKQAYLSLCFSLIVGFYFSALIYKILIPIIFYFSISFILLLIGMFSFYFFKKIAKLKIELSNKNLQRKSEHTLERYDLAKIKKVTIKWTTQHSIREIYIWLNNGQSIFLTGLTNFKKLRAALLAKINKQTVIKEQHEPINFDSPLFYPILGLMISNFSLLAFKSLLNLNDQQLNWGLKIFSGYLFLFGCYFLLTTPITKRSGKKTKWQDYLLGILMICSGIAVLFFVLKTLY